MQLFILLHLTILVILVLATFVERGNEDSVPADREARGTSKIAAEATRVDAQRGEPLPSLEGKER